MESRDTWWKEDDEDDPMTLAMQEAERQAEKANQPKSDSYQYPEVRADQNRNWQQDAAEEAAGGAQARATATASKPAATKPTVAANPTQTIRRTTARDGQSLVSQSGDTQMNFRIRYGADAEWRWVEEHEVELDRLAQGLPAKPAGQTGTNTATVGTTQPTAAVSSAGATTAAPGSKPWLEQGWTPAPTDVITITSGEDGVTRRVTGAYYLQALSRGEIDPTAVRPNIQAVTPGTDASPRILGEQSPGRTPTAALNAPSALVGGGTVPAGGSAPSGAAGTGTSSATPAPPSQPAEPMPTDGRDWVYVKHNTLGHRQWGLRSNVAAYPTEYTIEYDPKQSQTARMSNIVSTGAGQSAVRPSAPAVTATDTSKPLDTLVRLTGKPPEESQRIAQGISALMHGDKSGAWTEPYLNDVARLAWAKEQRSRGINADPLDAPEDYLEAWKDGFFGSDHSIPLVKELDQQMIDYAANKATATGKPFDWRDAFGPTGEDGLISRQVASNDCGPNAFATVLRSYGYNADPSTTFEYAKEKGYHNGDQFTGPYNFSRMLREEAGIDAQTVAIDWNLVDQELDAGRVVILSSGGHYWAVSSRRNGPNGTEYYGGATSAVVGNPEWATAGQISYGGRPNAMIITRSGPNPNARGVTAMGLQPAQPTPNRALLSTQTRANAEQRIRMSMQQNAANNTELELVERLVFDTAAQEEADPVLSMAMMDTESNRDPNATSRAGAGGLMQLMPATAREVGVTDVYNPEQNVRGGIRYFKRMLQRYDGNIDLALAAYNAGPGAVDQHGGIPPYPETQAYVRRVKARYQELQNRYASAR